MAHERIGGAFAVGGPVELALACRDLAATARFYGEALGLARVAVEGPGAAFRIGPEGGVVLRLLPAGPEDPAAGPLRLVLSATPHDQARAADWFRRIGRACRWDRLEADGRSGLFTTDPEGNAVALTAAPAGGGAGGAR